MARRRIRDDRGELAPLRRSYFYQERPWTDYRQHSTMQRRIFMLVAVALVPLVIFTQRTLSNWKGWSDPSVLWTLLAWSVFIGGFLVSRRVFLGVQRRKDRRASLCLACGTDMKPAPIESDGCAVCPNCGASWRLGPSSTQDRTHQRLFRRSPIIDDRNIEHNALADMVPAGLVAPPDDNRVPFTRDARRAYTWLQLGMVCGLFLGFSTFSFARNVKGDWIQIVIVSAFVIPMAVGLVSYQIALNRHVLPIMARRMVHDRRCPSCAAVLGASAEPDGCTVCGQCGAAWRVPLPGERTTRPCPTCEYELIDFEADATGRIKYPECGEAWYFTDA